MYLKKLELQGFKSFANKTTIEFTKDITCIVGPNGSGKSNISDAIRWVLGEQSVKTLRGNKMEDIIFSGTKNRKALGFAEVTIVFDNECKTIPIDFSEVAIRRRLFRNGDSEYYINNTKCRFKDVRDLFFDTGIGKNGYSIIGQGKIDEILSNKPEDRRAIFEEASGISKFKSKRVEAERKLDNTEKNLVRLNDIITEIKSQEETLKYEAETAEKYNEYYGDLKALEIHSAAKFIYNSDAKLKKYEAEALELENEYAAKQNSTELINEKLSSITDEIKLIESQIMENQRAELENTKVENNLRSEISLNRERIESLNNEKKRIAHEIEVSNNSIDTNMQLIESIKAELESHSAVLSEMNVNSETFNTALNAKRAELADAESSRESLEKNINELNTERYNMEIKLRTLSSIIEEKQTRLDLVMKQRLQLEKNESEIAESIKANNERILELKKTFNSTKSERIELESKTEENSKTISNMELKLNEYGNKYKNAITQRDFLSNLEDNFDGYYKSVKDFLKQSKKEKLFSDTMKGTIADIISVDEKYETAISIALGNNLQNIVVTTEDSAKEMVSYLKKKNLGRVTFLPMNTMSGNAIKLDGKSNSNVVGVASNLVEYDVEYKNIIEFILGRIIIVKDLNSASEVARQYNRKYRIITLDGDVINVGGSITGGSIKQNSNLLYRKNQLNKIVKDIAQLEKAISDLEMEREEFLKSISSDSERLSEYKVTMEELITQIDKLENNSLLLENNSENNDKYIKSYDTEIAEANEFITSSEVQKSELSKVIDEMNERYDKINGDLKDLDSIIIKHREDIERFSEENTKETINLNNFKNMISKSEDELTRLSNVNIELEQKNLTLSAELLENDENTKRIAEQLGVLEAQYAEHSSGLVDYDAENGALLEQKDQWFSQYNKLQTQIKEINQELLEIDKNINKVKFSVERDEFKKDDIIESLMNNYDFDIVESNLEELIETKPKSEYSIKELNRRIASLGPVNLNATEAYVKIAERLEFNLKQYNDLIEAKDKLKVLIKEIDSSMRTQFKASLEVINENFKEIFKILFNGGQGNIELADDEDILTAGIEIKVQPPGKKLQTISLLSGGERALTAVAILFSLLKTRPAPFCLLDEIDSALDEANIIRYINYLRTFDDIQFAIITHRKTAMEVADILYGVTMEEMGVSKVISMKLNEKGEGYV